MENNSTFELYCGEQSTDKNKSGLLAVVSGKEGTVFLTADHTNYQVWDQLYSTTQILKNTLNVVVPHHGGYCGATPVVKGNGIAAVSVGDNDYGHPVQNVLNEYDKAGYSVKQTEIVVDSGIPTFSKVGDVKFSI